MVTIGSGKIDRNGSPRVGVLALQGNFAAHAARLAGLGAKVLEVRAPDGVAELDALVIPGGESTTLLNLFRDAPLGDAIAGFARSGRPVFGTCAGAILLAAEVAGPAQPSLGLLDVRIERNAYGRQVDSFITRGSCPVIGSEPVELVFIRAPIIRRVGEGVEVLAAHDGLPVFVRQGNLLAATFHPEMTADPRIHAYFLGMIRWNGAGAAR